MEKNRIHTTYYPVTLAVCALVLSSWPVSAVPQTSVAAKGEQAMVKDISLTEDRYFSRQYANDPLEKRVERIELLVFGATQGGSTDERWARLKQAIASRAAASVSKPSPAASGTAKVPESSTQYPVLKTLEWRALKKTFTNESLDTRLNRLETKLFGQPSPGLAYVDRVDRLQRTLGIGVAAAPQTGPLGPAPKARARGQSLQDFANNFGSPLMPLPNTQDFGDESRFFSEFAHKDFPFNNHMNSTFGQMFAELNRQMSEMSQLGPGTWVYDQNSGMWVDAINGRKVKPGTPPTSPRSNQSVIPNFGPKLQVRPGAPIRQLPIHPLPLNMRKNDTMELPPYADPNSI